MRNFTGGYLRVLAAFFVCAEKIVEGLGVPSAQGCGDDCSPLKPRWHRAPYRSQGLTL